MTTVEFELKVCHHHTLLNSCDSNLKMIFYAVNNQHGYWSDFQSSVVFCESSWSLHVHNQFRVSQSFMRDLYAYLVHICTFCGYVLNFQTFWCPQLHSLTPQSNKIIAVSA